MERILTLENFLNQVGHDMGHGKLDVSGHYLVVTHCPSLPNPDTVKWPHDCEREAVLKPGALGKVLTGELLKPIRALRRRRGKLCAFRGWINIRGLKHHA